MNRKCCAFAPGIAKAMPQGRICSSTPLDGGGCAAQIAGDQCLRRSGMEFCPSSDYTPVGIQTRRGETPCCPRRGQHGTCRICSSTPLDGGGCVAQIANDQCPRRSGIAKAMPRLARSGDTTCAGTRRICSSTPLVWGAFRSPIADEQCPRRSGIAKAMPHGLEFCPSSDYAPVGVQTRRGRTEGSQTPCCPRRGQHGTRRICSSTPHVRGAIICPPPPPPRTVR
jgi:hypothetical protein